MSTCNVDTSAQKIDKRAVRRKAEVFLKQGLSKQEIFEQLKQEFQHAKVVAKVLKCAPTPNQKKKYRGLNVLLFFSLLPMLILVAYNVELNASFIYVFMLYVVVKVIPRFYIAITTFSFLSLVISSIMFFFETNPNLWAIWLMLGLNTVSLVLSYILNQKFCPNVEERKEKYIDKQGLTRMRIIYTFTE